MPSPSVSVIVPTYRRPGWLAEALESVGRQLYQPSQVIVVEDGADQKTSAAIAETRIPVTHLIIPHCGLPGRVRNHGIEHAHGDLVAFLDDDDRWGEEKLARQVELLAAHDRSPACYTSMQIEHRDGSLTESIGPPPRTRRLSTRSALLGGCFIFPSSILVRRTALQVAGGFDQTLRSAEDYALWLRLSRLGDFVHLNEPLVTIRRHGGGLSNAPPAEIWLNTIAVLDAERSAGGLTLGDRLRLRRVLALGFNAIGKSLPRESQQRRRYLWKAFLSNPLERRLWRRSGPEPSRFPDTD